MVRPAATSAACDGAGRDGLRVRPRRTHPAENSLNCYWSSTSNRSSSMSCRLHSRRPRGASRASGGRGFDSCYFSPSVKQLGSRRADREARGPARRDAPVETKANFKQLSAQSQANADRKGCTTPQRILAQGLGEPRAASKLPRRAVEIKCGKQRCACASDERARRGPYFSLTRNQDGRTHSRRLTPEQAERVREQLVAGRAFREQVGALWEACEDWADAELERERAPGAVKKGSRRSSRPRSRSRSRS